MFDNIRINSFCLVFRDKLKGALLTNILPDFALEWIMKARLFTNDKILTPSFSIFFKSASKRKNSVDISFKQIRLLLLKIYYLSNHTGLIATGEIYFGRSDQIRNHFRIDCGIEVNSSFHFRV